MNVQFQRLNAIVNRRRAVSVDTALLLEAPTRSDTETGCGSTGAPSVRRHFPSHNSSTQNPTRGETSRTTPWSAGTGPRVNSSQVRQPPGPWESSSSNPDVSSCIKTPVRRRGRRSSASGDLAMGRLVRAFPFVLYRRGCASGPWRYRQCPDQLRGRSPEWHRLARDWGSRGGTPERSHSRRPRRSHPSPPCLRLRQLGVTGIGHYYDSFRHRVHHQTNDRDVGRDARR